jgi:hypothetical protein
MVSLLKDTIVVIAEQHFSTALMNIPILSLLNQELSMTPVGSNQLLICGYVALSLGSL